MSRLTAAIVVNDRLAKAATKGTQGQWQPRSADELRNLTALAQAAVGFDASRGDMLTVEDLAFDENRAPPLNSMPAELLATAENSPVLVKYLTLLLGLLAIVAFGVRPALRRAAMTERDGAKAAGAHHELPGHSSASSQPALSAAEQLILEPERTRAQEILEQVSTQLKREPAQSSRLLQSWIQSE